MKKKNEGGRGGGLLKTGGPPTDKTYCSRAAAVMVRFEARYIARLEAKVCKFTPIQPPLREKYIVVIVTVVNEVEVDVDVEVVEENDVVLGKLDMLKSKTDTDVDGY